MKFSEAVNLYTSSLQFQHLAYSSKLLYSNGLKLLAPFDNKDIATITRPMVIRFADGLQSRPGRGKMAMVVMSNVFRYCYDRGIVTHNPAERIKFRKSEPIKRWEESEIALFLDKAPPTMRSAMLLALYTGQRVSDLVRIKWSDYDGQFIHLKQKKTGKELTIPVHPKLKEDLEFRHSADKAGKKWKPFIVSNAHGNPWTSESLRIAFSRCARSLGINKSIHGVRKATASMLAEKGCTPHQIKAITGHMTLKEVERYTLEVRQKDLAVEAMQKL